MTVTKHRLGWPGNHKNVEIEPAIFNELLKLIINRDLLDKMLHLFYCVLFPVRAF